MSANLGRRLYANFWETAYPFLGRVRPNRVSPTCDASSPRTFFNTFSTGHRRQWSIPSGRTTLLTRRFASGGFFVLGISSSSTAAETSAACIIPKRNIVAAQYIWRRGIQTSNDNRRGTEAANNTQPHDDDDSSTQSTKTSPNDGPLQGQQPKKPLLEPHQPASPSRHLMDRLPHMPHLHRPTKEELLAAANGFWSRLKVRFKWFSIRSMRPFNLDEITALFSWVLLGHVVWVVLGTTTFFSLLILAINTVFAQGISGFCSHPQSIANCIQQKPWQGGLVITSPSHPE